MTIRLKRNSLLIASEHNLTVKPLSWFYSDLGVNLKSARGLDNKLNIFYCIGISNLVHVLELRDVYFQLPKMKVRDDIMAKNFSNRTFVNIRLDSAELRKFDNWFTDTAITLDDLAKYAQEHGYKVSWVWYDDMQTFIATFSGTKDSTFNQTSSLSSRSDSLLEALAMTLYKSFVLCENEDWEIHETLDTRG